MYLVSKAERPEDGFSQSLQSNVVMQIRLEPFQSTCFSIHYLLTTHVIRNYTILANDSVVKYTININTYTIKAHFGTLALLTLNESN
jgi:hypothetical protein